MRPPGPGPPPLPLTPPLAPMLGRLVRQLPGEGHVYEPKWDGFRCLAFRRGDEVDLRSRHDRPLARYFPDLVAGVRAVGAERFVLDGEILVTRGGRFDFPALMSRLHPAASRVEQLAGETPAAFVAFDLLAVDDADLRASPFVERRRRLTDLLSAAAPPVHPTPATEDRDLAADWLEGFRGGGVDGVMAKHRDGRYEPGVRGMLKVKRERTTDCVLAGLRPYGDQPAVGSLLLGLYDSAQELRHVGVVTSFTRARRRALLDELRPLAVPLAGHPWEHGYLLAGGPTGRLGGSAGRWDPATMALDWVPLAPLRVCEVAYDQSDGGRLRHPARFRRWRPDRDPRSCWLEQLAVEPRVAPVPLELAGPGE